MRKACLHRALASQLRPMRIVAVQSFVPLGLSPQQDLGSSGYETELRFRCRHCKGALITLNLQPRHDLIQLAAGFVTPRDDTMTLEVYMNEGSMPPTCLAVGLPRMVKHLQSVHKDLETYARPVNVPTRTDIKDWPAGSLSVVAESSAAFQAFFCRPILDLAFGKEVRAVVSLRSARSSHMPM